MMKKALALAGAGAILLSVAGPAFGMFWWMGSDDVTIGNMAIVSNKVTTKADSGDNSIGGKCVFGGTIRTGAASAYSNVGNEVNGSRIACVGCDGDVDIHNNMGFVTNRVWTKAASGDNRIGGMFVGGGSITAGAAGATSIVTNFVNPTVVGY